ncbi:hypothetical protein [Mailhella sp.]|uniref:hypothetical protein n=1 Tax=Mailhella sp. TaxID=1981029 RepID=UPI00406347CE
MAYDIRLVKIVTGELIIGKYDAEAHALNEVAIMQTMPTPQGVQLMILPYGYPFDPEFNGRIEGKHFLFEYKHTPQDVQDKYLEACSNISLSSGGLNPTPPAGSGSGLIL